MSGRLSTVVITWTDGKQESYTCEDVFVRAGCLYLNQPRYPDNGQPHRRFPLANIRTWTEDSK